jgi:hypothetical protein
MNHDIPQEQELRSLQNRWSRRRLLTKSACLSCLFVLLIACVQWLPLINAKWSIRDDHRFVKLMGDKTRVDFHTFLEQINPPDAQLGSVVNRPVYYTVHASWMFILGNNVRSWQIAKIVVFGMVVTLSFLFLYCWVGLTAASILSIFIATLPAWEDVVPRANSELFGIAGLMLYFMGISFLLQERETSGEGLLRSRSVLSLVLVGLGAGLGVGSKENLCFTILFISFCFIGWSLLIRNRKLLLAQLVPVALGATITFFIFEGISRNSGRALYGQTFDPWRIAHAALADFFTGGPASWLPLVLAAFYAIRFCMRRGSFELRVALLEMMLIGAFLLNAGFYAGFDLAGRYAFPVNLIPVLAILPVICELERTEPSSQFSPVRKLALAAVFVCAIFPSIHGFSINLDRSFTYRRETRKFISQIDKVSKELTAHPEQPILFESFSTSDYEPLISLDIFFRSRKANNERFAKLDYASSQLADSPQRYIASLTERLVGPGRRFKSFMEIGTRPFFRITISAPEPDKEATGNFYQLH